MTGTGLYNGGRPGKRSGPSNKFYNDIHMLDNNPVDLWSAIISTYRLSSSLQEAHEVLAILGIDKDRLDEYRAEAKRTYQMLHNEGHSTP